jgi:single-stranded DNA-binding protein
MLWMNKIYLSGIVAEPPVRGTREGAPEHVRFNLWVSHRTRQGVSKRELYAVNGWNGVAAWAAAHLRQGQRVMVQGYLTQHRIALPGDGVATVNEITAEELFPGGGDTPAGDSREPGISKED